MRGGGQMKTFGFCSIDVQDSKKNFGVSAPLGENRDNSMLADFHNFRVVLIIVLQITPILMKIESWKEEEKCIT